MQDVATVPDDGESRHLSVVIAASAREVYDYARRPENLTAWAAGLASGVTRDGDNLVTESPMGTVRVRFAAENDLGVLDHTVTLPDGTEVLNPLRVVPHPHGAEVLFTVRRLGMTDVEFDRDCAAVQRDLESLKRLMET
ncbi:SRPBCC family protein [Rhodococcus kroppenstedtii]|uniref:SRPBCC family protein n=1 Tax=Rhodococcoides kroppenstedtii TaxID=293050 RepID=UPI001C9ABA87|nr:SRPBCC family protein [Rhodococcus kroppenstedtii]MBY6435636.1 SRPBCC family protein [Rhodococcus kroppenstedtii]